MEDFTPRVAEPTQNTSPEPQNASMSVEMEVLGGKGGLHLTSYELASYFNASPNDSHATSKIDYIVSELGKMGVEGTDALLFIQGIEHRLAPPSIGIDRLNHFWNYFKLMLASNDINKRKRLYEQ